MNYSLFMVLLIGVQLVSANHLPLLFPNLVTPSPVFAKYGVEPKQIEIKYHRQRINHFDVNDNRTFGQMYLYNSEFHKPDGPIILFVGGQEGLFPTFIEDGPVRDLAEIHNGYLLYPEHRYIGNSKPFANLSLENMQYMKVDQVLADLAHLIKAVKTNDTRFKNSKVILVGPSLSGTLVSWFRAEYPELSAGAWASSGPVEVKADVPEHKVEMGLIFERVGGKTCYNKIRDGFREIEEDLKKGNMTRFDKYLKICEGFDPLNDKDATVLVHTLGGLFSNLVASTNQTYIDHICESMIEVEDNIAAIATGLQAYIGGPACMDMNYNYTIEILRDEFGVANLRPFFYLACYEYGWWTSCEAQNQPFGTIARLDFYVDMCRDVFQDPTITRESLQKNAQRLNQKYGGFGGNYTNLYTTQGSLDPNKVVGLTTNVSPTAFTEVIYGATHANDIYYFFHDATEPIKKAQMEAKLLISKWLYE